MKIKNIIISSLLTSSTLLSQTYDATGITSQGDLFYKILQGLKPSDYNTIVFKGSGDFEVFENIQGGVPPYSGTLGVDSLFQNIRFEGSSKSDTFFFNGGRSSPCTTINCIPYKFSVSTHSLTIDNIAWSLAPDQAYGDYIEDFIINNRGATPGEINLNNGQLKLDQGFGSNAQLYFGGATVFNITGIDNKIIAPGGAINRSIYDTKMHLHAGSKLEVSGTTELNMRDYGYLQMDAGSELEIIDSKVVMTKQATASTNTSVIDSASIGISGLFGSTPSSLVLSNPTIKNSSITLGQNTRFASSTKSNGVLQPANFYFEGDNKITLALGSALAGFSGENTDEITSFNFKNGRTDIIGSGASSRLFAQTIHMDNAHLYHENVGIQNDLKYLSLSNGSRLSHNENNGESLENLSLLSVVNSTIESDYSIGISAITKATFNNATIKQTDSRLTRPTSFYLNGVDINADTKATVTFAGNSVFESRIDPAGKDIGIPVGLTTGFLTYADALYFTRQGNFTDEASSVNGLSNLTVELKPFATGLLAQDYSNGGENSDGIYDILIFNQGGTATTNATADSDTVAVRMSGDMPALLKATQVKTPSADNQVSVKLETQALSSLTSHSTITTPNQQNGLNLLINSANSGNTNVNNALNTVTNSQLQTHTNTVHAEPYSSYMTVSLEHTDMIMNNVLSNTALTRNLNSGNLERKKNFWIDISHSKGDIDGSSGLGSFDYTLNTITLGNDFIVKDNKRAGLFVSFGTQKMDEHDTVTQDFNSDNYYVGGYLNQNTVNDWILGSVFGYGYGKHKSNRVVKLANLNENIKGKFDSHSIYGAINISKTMFTNDWISLRPEIGLDYTYYQQEKIKESGDTNFNLTIDKANAQAIVASIGLNAKFKSISDTNNIYPLAFIKYEHDFYANKNNTHKIDAALSSNSNYKQEFEGQNRGENSLLTGIGLASDISNALQINGGLVYSKHSHGKEIGAGVSLKYQF